MLVDISTPLALDHIPIGVCVFGSDMRVLHWNRRFEEWTGIKRADIVGTPLGDHFPGVNSPRYVRRIAQMLEGGPPAVFSAQLHGAVIPSLLSNGDQRRQNTTVSAITTEHGARVALLVAEDVSELVSRISQQQALRKEALAELGERRRTEGELALVADELRRSNRDLDDFATVVAHDLKAPLRHLGCFLEFLVEDHRAELSDDAMGLVTRMESATRSMTRLVSDVLSYSRVATRQQPASEVDLAEVMREVVSLHRPAIDEAGASVEVGDMPRVLADDTQMRQLFQNLVGNALKFRAPGRPPAIHIRASGGPGDDVIRIDVCDNGIGFEPSMGPQIFDMCRRLNPAEKYEGSGVGLAICRRIVERHHGHISAHGQLDMGATISVTLPASVLAVEQQAG